MIKRKNRRMLRQAFRVAGANKIIAVYFGWFLIAAAILRFVEPSLYRFTDSLWYCFAVATTVGFGDFTAVTHLGRIVTVVLSIYSLGVVAIFTAVITSYFLDLAKARASESAKAFLADLERLPEMSQDELRKLSERAKRFAGENHR